MALKIGSLDTLNSYISSSRSPQKFVLVSYIHLKKIGFSIQLIT